MLRALAFACCFAALPAFAADNALTAAEKTQGWQPLYERSGDLFDLISSDIENVNEHGNWNAIEIIVDHGHMQFFQNGHKTVDTTLWTPAWNALVTKTKFARMEDYARFHKGRIALQG